MPLEGYPIEADGYLDEMRAAANFLFSGITIIEARALINYGSDGLSGRQPQCIRVFMCPLVRRPNTR